MTDRTKAATPQRGDAEQAATPEAARRRAVLERAKSRSRAGADARPGPMEGTPSFEQVNSAKTMRPAPGHDSPPVLSKETMAGLEAVARVNTKQTTPEEEEAETAAQATGPVQLTREDIVEMFGTTADVAAAVYSLVYPDNSDVRRRIEKRVGPLDIGQFLMNGVLSQAVPVVAPSEGSKGLVIAYQTVQESVEAMIDRLLADEAARTHKARDGEGSVDVKMSGREYVRRQNEYALAVHIESYGGQKWPGLYLSGGAVDEKAIEARLSKVRQMPSLVFSLAIDNLSWFIDRVQRTLEVAVLGNG